MALPYLVFFDKYGWALPSPLPTKGYLWWGFTLALPIGGLQFFFSQWSTHQGYKKYYRYSL